MTSMGELNAKVLVQKSVQRTQRGILHGNLNVFLYCVFERETSVFRFLSERTWK